MLRWIVGSSLKFRFIVVGLAAAMVFFGMERLRNMPVDVFPEFAPPIVEIQTPSLGLSPTEVESLVTIPLEEALAGTPGLDMLRSKSVPDLSSVKLYFYPDTDLLLARQTVAERVALALPTIPRDIGPPMMVQPLSATSRFMKIGITSDTLSLTDLSMITYWTIRARLLTVPGVANVAIWGERLKMLHVQMDPRHMAAHNVTVHDVMEVTANAVDAGLLAYSKGTGTMIGTGGFLDTPNQRLQVRFKLPIETPINLAEVVFPGRYIDGRALQLDDVAVVKEDHQPLIGDGVIDDDVGLLLIVEKFPWANTLQATSGVEEALDAMRPGLPEIKIDHEIFRPATFIEASIGNLTNALLIGSVLVVLVLCLFLYEWRTALISCVAIPLSLVAAGLILYLRDTTINTMILAGFVIALGAVVDDAIVDIENIVRRLRQYRKEGRKMSMTAVILDASVEVRHAIIYSTLIEVTALLPVFVMEGLSGAFFKPLAMSYALAVSASTIVALTVTPAMGYILLRNAPLDRRESPLLPFLHRVYNALLKPVVAKPSRAYATVGVIALAGIVVTPRLGQELLPSFKERDFLMHWLTKPGTSLPEMDRITIQGCKELRTIPGVRNCGSHIGQALIMDEVVGVDFGENWISVDPAVDYQETVDAIQRVVDGYPGLYRDVLTYLKERIREVLTGTSEAITIRIYGLELPKLRELGRTVKDSMEGIEGIIDLHMGHQEEVPQILVKVDLERARHHGLKPGDVRRAAGVMLSGQEVGDIFRQGKAYDVQVWTTPETRHSLTSVENLPLDSARGGFVRLKDVADVRIAPTPNKIKREDMHRYIDVGANVHGRDLGSVVADVEAALAGIEFPHEYHPELLGEYAERQAAQRRMSSWTVIAVVSIFVLLSTSFSSVRLATIGFLLLPAALVGGVLAAYFGGGVISLGSLVGFLTVLGIAARNGILMVNHFQHLERFEGETFGPALVLRGAQERLAPILMTALTTALALAPLAWWGNLPGHEIEYPMAVVILGGLLTSTLLNLFVLPPLYLRFAKPAGATDNPGQTLGS
jgi:CzcA family heavy metal efflux pump